MEIRSGGRRSFRTHPRCPGAVVWPVLALLSIGCLEPTTEAAEFGGSITIRPRAAALWAGEEVRFRAELRTAEGDTGGGGVAWETSGGRIGPDGRYVADAEAGDYVVVARSRDEGVADTARVTIYPGGPVIDDSPWRVTDDGARVDVVGPILHLVFAYDAEGADGWFLPYGGGRDGGIVELYHLPTSRTRNLVFRNGPYGSRVDQLDLWEAEPSSEDRSDHNAPDFASGTDARLDSRRVRESGGRVFLEFDFQFEAWHIQRTYILYPWGELTVHSRLTLTESGPWNYLGHRFLIAAGRYGFEHDGTVYDWGGRYAEDGEYFHAWTDGYGPEGILDGDGHYRYDEQIRPGIDRTTASHMFGRADPYSGLLIDDTNGNDPDILLLNGDSATYFSPFERISRAVGGTSYIETALWSSEWAPDDLTHVDLTWFYMTHESFVYDQPMNWPGSLGTWTEVFHLLFRSDLGPDDYLPIWRSRARELGREAPFDVVGARVELNELDRRYHLIADPDADRIEFRWRRASEAARPIDYRTAFVVEGFEDADWVEHEGPGAVEAYSGPGGATLVVLTGPQPAVPATHRITLGKLADSG